MASRLFAPASSERVDNSGSLRASEVNDTADNEPPKRRSSSLVGDLAASILGADVLAARKAPAPPFPDAEDASDGTRYFFAGGGRSAKISSHGTLSPALVGQSPQRKSDEVPRCSLGLHAGKCAGGGCVRGSRPCGWDGSIAGDGPSGRDDSGARPGGPDDRRSVAVQLQLSPDGGRRRPRLRDAAAASGASGRNRRPSLAGRRSAAIQCRGSCRRRPDGPQVVNGEISRARTPLLSRYGPSRIAQEGKATSLAASALLLDDLGPQLRRGLLDAQPQIVRVDGVHCRRRGRRPARVPGVARRV